MPLLPGQTINNRYRIVRLLGQGGFGAVYRAWDITMEAPCAVKENLETSEVAARQFKREASMLYKLRHPSLPKVTDYFSLPDQGQYLVMEFIEGENLQEKLEKAGGPLPEEQVMPWIHQICDALIYLHNQTPPIIHRDIKPANIRITPQGQATLVDFGIAKVYDPSSRTTLGARAVTPGFSAPEQYGQGKTDAASDIYSLGATLYTLLTGKAPPDSVDILTRRVEYPPSVKQICPQVSSHVSVAIERSMHMDSTQRFASAEEFKRALSTPLVAPQPPRVQKPTVVVAPKPVRPSEIEKKRSFPWLWVGLVVVFVVGLGAVVTIGLLSRGVGFSNVPTITPVPTQAPAVMPAFRCEDPIGCVDIPPGAPIHIAYALVVAGPNETLGIDSRNGIEIAIADKGKVLGHDIQLTGENTGCNAEAGQAAGAKLAADPTIVAVIGTSCSSEARVAMSLLSKAGFVVISPSNTAPDLTEAGNENNYPGYLRTAINDIFQGEAAARFAWEYLKVKKAATIHDGSLYAEKLQQVFADVFRTLGGVITVQEVVDPSQTDFSPVLAHIAAGGPEIIYFPIFMPAGGFIIRQAKGVAGVEKTILMGADGLFSPDVVEAAGDAVEGFYVSSPFVSGADYDAFVAKYKARYGKEPISIFHAHAYDATMMMLAAIEKVAIREPNGTLHIGRQALRDAMYGTRDFKGLTGMLTCTPTGDCANPVIATYIYHAGIYPPMRIWP